MTPERRLLVATGNPGKLREFREILEPLGVRVIAPGEIGYRDTVPEDGETLEENAEKKARAAAAATGFPALADDSGLFVEALDGAPGIRSARYAGEQQDPVANCAKLLRALDGTDRREAAFRCVIALVEPEGPAHRFDGVCHGRITEAPRGTNGFGYDPVFEVPALGRTFAELDSETKHRLSHRGGALRKLRRYWLEQGGKTRL